MKIYLIACVCIVYALLFSSCENVEKFERNAYSFNGMKFSMRDYPEWTELYSHQLPWGQAFANLDSTKQGFITSYFRDTINLSLRSTQIRVEYFSRRLPNCSVNDSVSMYMERIMQRKYAGLSTQRDTAVFQTRDGRNVAWVEAVSSLNSIWFSWLYIPMDDYYLAMNLSAYSENEYKQMRTKFMELGKSFEAYE